MFAAWISKDARKGCPEVNVIDTARDRDQREKGVAFVTFFSLSGKGEGGRDNCSSLKYRITLQIAIFNPCVSCVSWQQLPRAPRPEMPQGIF